MFHVRSRYSTGEITPPAGDYFQKTDQPACARADNMLGGTDHHRIRGCITAGVPRTTLYANGSPTTCSGGASRPTTTCCAHARRGAAARSAEPAGRTTYSAVASNHLNA